MDGHLLYIITTQRLNVDEIRHPDYNQLFPPDKLLAWGCFHATKAVDNIWDFITTSSFYLLSNYLIYNFINMDSISYLRIYS